MFHPKNLASLRDQVSLLYQQGFTLAQIKRYMWYRKLYCPDCYQSGCSASDQSRLIFARWLYEHGKIEG